MRVGALYDIHGNLPALEAVLADPRFADADVVLVGGDVVAGPQPRAVLERLLEQDDVRFIRGNADRWVTGTDEPDIPATAIEEIRWSADQLDDRERADVYAWPFTTSLPVDGLGAVLFCHATPGSDTQLVTPTTPEDAVDEALGSVAEELVVCGHIHVQYDRGVGHRRLVNAGSVGRPNERPARAYWALLGAYPPVQLLHTEYDIERAIGAIAAVGYPSDDLAAALREPPSAEETIAFFEGLRGA